MMKPPLTMLSVLLLFGAAQGAFLTLVLARLKRGRRSANRFLAWLLFFFSIGLVEGFLSVTYSFTRVPWLIGINWPLLFLYGPLLYFYVKSLTEPQWRIERWKLSVHFIPTVIVYLYMLPFFLADPGFKIRVWLVENGRLRNYSSIVDPILVVAIMQIAGYLVLSLRLLKFHSRTVRQNFSSLENVSLSWLRTLIIVFFGLLCLFTFSAVVSPFYGVYKEAEYLLNFMIAVAIYGMGYKGITQPDIFGPLLTAGFPGASAPGRPDLSGTSTAAPAEERESPFGDPSWKARSVPEDIAFLNRDTGASGVHPSKPQSAEEMERPDKYKKSALSAGQMDTILARLLSIMEKEKPYREMGLTLPALSRMLDVSPHHLSQVINGKLNKSFFDLVNEYRVQEAKHALVSAEAQRFSILGIAMDVGFNSKSAFYTAFKKHAGMTPSQFKERRASPDHT